MKILGMIIFRLFMVLTWPVRFVVHMFMFMVAALIFIVLQPLELITWVLLGDCDFSISFWACEWAHWHLDGAFAWR